MHLSPQNGKPWDALENFSCWFILRFITFWLKAEKERDLTTTSSILLQKCEDFKKERPEKVEKVLTLTPRHTIFWEGCWEVSYMDQGDIVKFKVNDKTFHNIIIYLFDVSHWNLKFLLDNGNLM